eukprot:12709377-Heterocapsa_arctica.AAC.1
MPALLHSLDFGRFHGGPRPKHFALACSVRPRRPSFKFAQTFAGASRCPLRAQGSFPPPETLGDTPWRHGGTASGTCRI